MAWQLIFTSAPRTLSAGQSGYGTVARSADLREGLAQRLEQLSYYAHVAGVASRQPVVCAYRILDLRGTKYHALTRIQDAGLDFTHRTNHLAHHLVFAPAELPTLPPPTVIFQQWDGWRADWRGEPRLLEASDWGNFSQLLRKIPLPAQAWQRTTGDAGSAAALLERPCVNGCYLLAGTEEETPLLALFGESLQLLDPAGQSPDKLWQHPFTTLLQAEDQPADFCWRGCAPDLAALRGNDAPVIVAATLRPPTGPLAQLARQGLQPIPRPIVIPAAAAAAPAADTPSPTRRRLNLQDTSRRVPSCGWDESSATPAVPRSRGGGLSFKIPALSPRVLWPAVGILILALLLLGGFVWPGFFKTRSAAEPQTPPAPKTPVAPKASPLSANDLTIAPGPDLKSQISNLKSPPPAPPPSEVALSQLRERFATLETKTFLYVCEPGQDRLAFLPGKELERLLRVLFTDSAVPLNPDAVECFVDFDRLEIDVPKPPPLPLKVDSTGGQKSLSAASDAGRGFTLSAAEWLKNSTNLVSVVPAGTPKVIKILFRPVAGQKSFTPFRLVLVFEAAEPITLSRSLLQADRASFEASIGQDLLARWRALAREGAVGCQLRPSLKGDAKLDLLDHLKRCPALPPARRPAAGEELSFTLLRERIGAEFKSQDAKASKLGAQVLEMNRRIEANNQHHLPIGNLLDLKEEALKGFLVFAEKQKQEPSRGCFETYLHRLAARCKLDKPAQDLIPNKDTPEAKALTDLAQFHAALVAAGHAKALASVPQDYFAKRWQELGLIHERNRQRQLLADVQKAAADLRALLDVTPASLDETPVVRLWLNRPGGLPVEFIRFDDPIEAKTGKAK
jgi:hypothetical protein